ncbi:unnamed protein product [Cylicocyclus nassatus]|uniref:BTB domain-containing protein n=1 Tax=Cylicocyclus nassatus TaxID=53992 RepID=A0AA36DUH2_CYLNA|nr:unnamed protein product [Cylicocyclus nassatus]
MLEDSVVLVMADKGYAVVKRNFCGFEWQTEVKDSKDHAEIILSCNRGVEGSSWQCTADITVHIPGVSKVVSAFHSKHRSTAIAVPRTELGNDIKITIGLQDVSGYRDVAMFEHDFTRASELTNACITFENSDTRVYVIREVRNSQYLQLGSMINSFSIFCSTRRFATLLTRMVPSRESTPVFTSSKSECSDLDVLSSRTTLTDPLCTEDGEVANIMSLQDDDVTTSPSTVCQEDGIYLLRGVSAGDFITLLKAIHPPFAEVTNENVESLLATAFRLGVEHIIWKCETFLRTEGARRSFDVFGRFVFAITYKMSALENDCLAALQSVNDVRTMLTDSRMESAPQELRTLLLETLFQRLNSETCPATLKAKMVSESSQTCFCLSGSANDAEVASTENGPHLCEGMARREFEQEEIQGRGKMSLNTQEKAAEDVDKIANDACATSSQLDQLPNEVDTKCSKQTNERRISVARRRKARKRNPECKPEYNDFPELFVCETLNVHKFSKKFHTIWYGAKYIFFSAHDIFVDLVLPPTKSLGTVVSSFASHFFTKIYNSWLSRAYFSEEPQRIPFSMIEIISRSIIVGCEFDVQLYGNNLLFDKLKAYLKKQLLDYEHVSMSR